MSFRELFIETDNNETYEWSIDLEPGSLSGVSYVKDKKKVDKILKDYRKEHAKIDPDEYMDLDPDDPDYDDDYFAPYEDLINKYMKKLEKVSLEVY